MDYYIGYKETDKLLCKYPQLKAQIANLQIELAKLKTDGKCYAIPEEELIKTLALGNRIMSDMPHSAPGAGDKMTRILLLKDRIIREDYPQELKETIDVFGDTVERIDTALQCVDSEESLIVNLKCIQGKRWQDISEVVGLSPDRLGQIKKQATEKIAASLCLPWEQYDFCMERVR